MKKKLLNILLIISMSLVLTSNVEPDKEIYEHIDELISLNKLNEATQEVNRLLLKDQNSVRLLFQQTQIWVKKVNQNYDVVNLKTAFHFYEKAYPRWAANSLLRQRYNELKKKRPLKDGVMRKRSYRRKSGRRYYAVNRNMITKKDLFQASGELNDTLKEINNTLKANKNDEALREAGLHIKELETDLRLSIVLNIVFAILLLSLLLYTIRQANQTEDRPARRAIERGLEKELEKVGR